MYELSKQDLHCLHSVIDFVTETLFATRPVTRQDCSPDIAHFVSLFLENSVGGGGGCGGGGGEGLLCAKVSLNQR